MGPALEQLLDGGHRLAAVPCRQIARELRHRVHAPDQLVAGQRLRSLVADQAATDDAYSEGSAVYVYSDPVHPLNSKLKGSSSAPAARMAWRVSSGRDA